MILRGIFHVVSGFSLHFMLYRGNLDCFSNSVFHLVQFHLSWDFLPNDMLFELVLHGRIDIFTV